MAGGLDAALSIAVGGLNAEAQVVGITADNIANANTAAYKRWIAVLHGGAAGGAPLVTAKRDTSQGFLYTTGVPTDLALAGNGYFQVALPDGSTAYTRAGNFAVDAQGRLVDSLGHPVVGPVTLPNGVTLDVSRTGAVVTGGQISVASFPNPGGLSPSVNNALLASDLSGSPVSGDPGSGGRGEIIQGAVETSNVDLATEFVNLIVARGAYKASAAVIRTADEMMATLLDAVKA